MSEKAIKYKCKNCGFEKKELYPEQAVAEITKKCPECNRIQYTQVIPSYFEQMKEKLKK